MFSRSQAVTRALLVAGMVLAPASAALAQFTSSATTTFTVQARVQKTCTVTANALDFGTYDAVSGAAVNQTTTISVACTKNTLTRIDLNDGTNGTRRMKSGGGELLAYELYQDSGRTTRWGTGGGGAGFDYTAPDRGAHDLTVYGQVIANQNVAAATDYGDTVTVTVNY